MAGVATQSWTVYDAVLLGRGVPFIGGAPFLLGNLQPTIEQWVRHFKVSPGESPTKNATRKHLSVRKNTHQKATDAHTQAVAGGARDGGGEKD